MKTNKKNIVLIGPSTTGKTSTSIKLAKQYNLNVLNADSRQVYKNLNYSTGKLSTSNTFNYKKYKGYWDIEGIKYFGYDIVNPNINYNTTSFYKFSKKIISPNVIITGGTGMYLKYICYGGKVNTSKPNLKLRKDLNKLQVNELQNNLKDLGFKLNTLNNSELNNKQRLIRKIELIKNKGTQKTLKPLINNFKVFGINLSSNEYSKNINNFIDNNFKQIVSEVMWLNKNYPNSAVLKGFIFNEVNQYLNGKVSKNECKEKIYYSYKQYIKRQMTYFKKHFTQTQWFSSKDKALNQIKLFLN